MDLQTFLAILGGLLALGAVSVAVARYFTRNQRQIDLLRDEIKILRDQTGSLKTAALIKPSGSFADESSRNVFRELIEVSDKAADAVGAEIHSISIPTPLDAPTDLKIIHSTDPNAPKIVGRAFPINKGHAGWAFGTQKPYFRNDASSDPKHFGLVDKAAGTRTGEGAILSVPLLAGGRCHGIMQFMKSIGGTFTESDADVAMRWAPKLARLLIELAESPQEDIPSIARGNTIHASVMFSDIRDFSTIASKVRIETSVDLLNEYYTRILAPAAAKGGRLQEYVGDGLFVYFSLSSPTASARAAVASAIEMQAEYQKLIASWIDYGHPVSRTRNTHSIGIASGVLYSGLAGHPKNRQEKLIGSAVNLASHLCEGAKEHGSIVLCEETAELIKSDNFAVGQLSLPIGTYYQVLSKIDEP